jgi:hypothetical protein
MPDLSLPPLIRDFMSEAAYERTLALGDGALVDMAAAI